MTAPLPILPMTPETALPLRGQPTCRRCGRRFWPVPSELTVPNALVIRGLCHACATRVLYSTRHRRR